MGNPASFKLNPNTKKYNNAMQIFKLKFLIY